MMKLRFKSGQFGSRIYTLNYCSTLPLLCRIENIKVNSEIFLSTKEGIRVLTTPSTFREEKKNKNKTKEHLPRIRLQFNFQQYWMKKDHRTFIFLKNNTQQLRNYTYPIQSSLGVNEVLPNTEEFRKHVVHIFFLQRLLENVH